MAREDIRIAPPQTGWDLLQFVDGYKAQIVGATTENVDGVDWVKFYLLPFDDLAKRFNITHDMLDRNKCLYMKYPKHMVITLNEDDPTRKLRFCMLNFEGKETHATRWFKGITQLREIEKLRGRIDELRVENATLKEENVLLKTNIPKYIKNNFSSLASQLMPVMRQGMEDAHGEHATTKEVR